MLIETNMLPLHHAATLVTYLPSAAQTLGELIHVSMTTVYFSVLLV